MDEVTASRLPLLSPSPRCPPHRGHWRVQLALARAPRARVSVLLTGRPCRSSPGSAAVLNICEQLRTCCVVPGQVPGTGAAGSLDGSI